MKKHFCSWIGRIIIVKMPIIPQSIYRFNIIPINSDAFSFLINWHTDPKTHTEMQGTQYSKTVLKIKYKNWDLHFLIPKLTTNL